MGLLEPLGGFYHEARWQRCVVHYYRNVFSVTPSGKLRELAAMLKATHAQDDRAAATQKAAQVVAKLREMKLAKAAELVGTGIAETFSYYEFPRERWRCLRTKNPMERIIQEIRRRTREVGAFPDGQLALMLVAARLRHVDGAKWGARRCLDMERLRELAVGTCKIFHPPWGGWKRRKTTHQTKKQHRKCEKFWTLPPIATVTGSFVIAKAEAVALLRLLPVLELLPILKLFALTELFPLLELALTRLAACLGYGIRCTGFVAQFVTIPLFQLISRLCWRGRCARFVA